MLGVTANHRHESEHEQHEDQNDLTPRQPELGFTVDLYCQHVQCATRLGLAFVGALGGGAFGDRRVALEFQVACGNLQVKKRNRLVASGRARTQAAFGKEICRLWCFGGRRIWVTHA